MTWRPLGAIPPPVLSDGRKKLHRAGQWLARIARSYYPPAPDDSHTALAFHPPSASMGLGPVEGARGPVVPSFVLPHMALSLHNDPSSVVRPLGGLDEAQREAAVRDALESVGLDPARLMLDLPYADEIPVPTDDDAPRAQYAAEIALYYANLHDLLAELSDPDGRISPIRLWPHHFDLARLITLDDGPDPHTARSIGVGLAPDDGAHGQPYLYVAPWPPSAAATPPQAPSGLRWHHGGFTALVATAEEIMLGADAETHVRTAIAEGVALCRAMLADVKQ